MFCRGKVPYCTSYATFPPSAKRESGTTGTVRHFSSTEVPQAWNLFHLRSYKPSPRSPTKSAATLSLIRLL